MASSRSRIAADVVAAQCLLGSKATSAAPRVLSITYNEDDGAVNFAVEGYDDFTACLPDPYPGEPILVYGPDDFALEHKGTVEEAIAAATVQLATGILPLSRTQSEETSPMDPDDLVSPRAVTEEVEPSLARDLARVRRFFGGNSVSCVEMAAGWRIRLTVGLNALSGPHVGKPLIEWMAADAWGINPDLPLVLEIHVPSEGYLTRRMSAKCVNAVFQDGNDNFQLEQQMKVQLAGFCALVLGHELADEAPTVNSRGKPRFSDRQLEMIQRSNQKKIIMMSEAQADSNLGFLVHLMLYAQARAAKMHEYCALCDQAFGLAPMLMRTVCVRPLCSHQLIAFGNKITSAQGETQRGEITELLYFMLERAANGTDKRRRDMVLDPYPEVYADGGKNYFELPEGENHCARDYQRVEEVLGELRKLRSTISSQQGPAVGAAWTAMVSRLGSEAGGLLQWLAASNRTYLMPLRSEQRIEAFGTEFQYLMLSAPRETEERFQALKTKHGTRFAFHGSHIGNWHSILRNGLKNASNTPMMTAGAAYGSGIYMARASPVSLQFSGVSVANGEAPTPPELRRQITGNRSLAQASAILAVCEVIKHKSVLIHNNYQTPFYVASNEEMVCTRFLLVYPGQGPNIDLVENGPVVAQIKELMENMNVGVCLD